MLDFIGIKVVLVLLTSREQEPRVFILMARVTRITRVYVTSQTFLLGPF